MRKSWVVEQKLFRGPWWVRNHLSERLIDKVYRGGLISPANLDYIEKLTHHDWETYWKELDRPHLRFVLPPEGLRAESSGAWCLEFVPSGSPWK
jgi:hypothetical protein